MYFTCRSLRPCCNHKVNNPFQPFYLRQSLMADLQTKEDLRKGQVPSLSNCSDSAQFVVAAADALSPRRSQAVGPSLHVRFRRKEHLCISESNNLNL